jgi:hypothetical protein
MLGTTLEKIEFLKLVGNMQELVILNMAIQLFLPQNMVNLLDWHCHFSFHQVVTFHSKQNCWGKTLNFTQLK